MNLSDIQHQITERASAFLNRGTHDLFIDGQWVAARTGQRLSTVNPATEAVIAEVASAGPADVDLAVRAAHLIGDGLYGIDIKEADGRFLIIEINDNPSIDAGNEDGVLKDELYLRIMRCFHERLERRRQ